MISKKLLCSVNEFWIWALHFIFQTWKLGDDGIIKIDNSTMCKVVKVGDVRIKMSNGIACNSGCATHVESTEMLSIIRKFDEDG